MGLKILESKFVNTQNTNCNFSLHFNQILDFSALY